MKKIISIPPNYFYLAIAIVVAIRFIFPSWNIIPFPLNLSGIILLAIGFVGIAAPYKLFVKHGTPERFEPSKCVVTDGLYRVSRNPMYLASFILLIGETILVQNVLSFIAPILFFFIMNFMFIPFEEEKMLKECGKDYADYKIKVRRWI